MNKVANYAELKKEFHKYASWAIWAESETLAGNIGDWSVLTDESVTQNANPNYVFVGLNAAEHDHGAETVAWFNFHSRDRHQKDYKLRYALCGTKYWGAYITDIIKGYECTKSEEVMKYIKGNPQKYEEHIARFRNEIKLLAGDKKPMLIAMGVKAYKLLRPLKNDFVIVKIPHYSAYNNGYGNPEYYKNRVREILGVE